MEWNDAAGEGGVHEYVWYGVVDGENLAVVWRWRENHGYDTDVRVQVVRNHGEWGDAIKTPEGTTVEEAKALALVLYRMGG